MKKEKLYTVYQLKFPNGKLYIGIALRFEERMRSHKCLGGKKSNKPVYHAIGKYGWENVIVSKLYENLSPEQAYETEIRLIKELGTTDFSKGYNIAIGGRTKLGSKNNVPSSMKGRKMSPEHISNLIAAKKGKSYTQISSDNATIYAVKVKDHVSNDEKIFKNAIVFARSIGVSFNTVYNHIRRNSTLLSKRYTIRKHYANSIN